MKIKEDLTGRIFGQLTVICRDLTKIGLERGSFWICRCICLRTKSVSRHSLVNHGTKSCGCLQKLVAMKGALPNAGADRNSWLSKYKRRSKENDVVFSLSDEEFYDICSMNCFYCNDRPSEKNHGYKRKNDTGTYFANGIDRLDPRIGYTKDNSVACCKVCNFMKTDKTQNDFIRKVLQIADNMRNKNVNS